MGYQKRLMGVFLWMYLISCFSFIGGVNGSRNESDSSAVKGVVVIHGKSSIGKIDNDFVCATIDWWPPQKCDYGKCSWGHASLLNLVSYNIIIDLFFVLCLLNLL